MANYKVLASSITLPGGSALQGDPVTTEQLGDMLELHLSRDAIELSTEAEKVDLSKLKKDELIAHAESEGVEVSESMTKAEIIEAIEAAEE